MKSLAIAAFLVALLVPCASAQIVTIGTGTQLNTATSYPTPYGNFYKGARAQFLIQAAELNAVGLLAGAITSVGFDVVTPGGGPLTDFEIKMGHSTSTDLSGGWDPGTSTVFGGVGTVYQDVAGWNDHILSGSFSWNGTDSIVIEICFWNGTGPLWTTNAVVNSTATTFTSSLDAHSDSASSCATTTFVGYQVRPNIRFTAAAVLPPTFQVNSPEATLEVNGEQTAGYVPAVSNQSAFTCGGAVAPVSGTINLGTQGVPGALFEMVMIPAPAVALGSGGISLGSEILNISVGAVATWTYLNGGTGLSLAPIPGLNLPGATGGSVAIPYAINSTLDMTMQAVFVGAAIPGGFKLTQASELHVAMLPAVPSIPGPDEDDTNLIIDVTAAPTCWFPSGVSFNGTSYNNIAISPNGRILFSAIGDVDFSATVGEALTGEPFFGFWTDLNVLTGGTITINNPAPGILRADFNAAAYLGEPGAGNTFGIEIDDNSQIFSLDGLGGIVPNPVTGGTQFAGDAQFLGLSVGLVGGATDPGLTTFSAGGGGPAIPNATDMLYDHYDYTTGVGGLVGSLATPGLSEIQFNYISGVGFLWTGL